MNQDLRRSFELATIDEKPQIEEEDDFCAPCFVAVIDKPETAKYRTLPVEPIGNLSKINPNLQFILVFIAEYLENPNNYCDDEVIDWIANSLLVSNLDRADLTQKIALWKITSFLETLAGNVGVYIERHHVLFSRISINERVSNVMFILDENQQMRLLER